MVESEKTVEALVPDARITDFDVHLFKEGNHFRLWDKLGVHPAIMHGTLGAQCALWAPNAHYVSIVGSFNGWDRGANPLMRRNDDSGVWEGFVHGLSKGDYYKFHVASRYLGYRADKGDPFAFSWETPPGTASRVWDLEYEWNDHAWMHSRSRTAGREAPLSIYEVHLGSWRRGEGNRFLTYRELAQLLPAYLKQMGFTHVEFLPIMEHPFYGSWGYQTVGYFAPTSRYGTPQDFMFLIDELHRNNIGVILDWVPSHFPTDEHGLGYFDGTHLFEHADPRRGFHPDWTSFIFNYGRNEVRSFLISSALFWLETYHIDGLRVDAVASMLYNDYSRKDGEWLPNQYGGRDNIEAIEFLKQLNQVIYSEYPDVITIAEESTAWPLVSRPTYAGGLGFGYKWNMGWMHDTLVYFSKDPVHRKYHQNDLTFSMLYGFNENFVLPLSHDEVVHGKKALLSKMPKDDWQKMANLRLLLGYMYSHPGKKLLFMGTEVGQWSEWSHERSIDWHLLDYERHRQISRFVADINALYVNNPALYEMDCEPGGFSWIDCSDWEKSIVSYLRRSRTMAPVMVVVCNMTPSVHFNYRIGVPATGTWEEVLNSDAREYGGSGQGNFGLCQASPIPFHGFDQSLSITIPPLAVVIFRNMHPKRKGVDHEIADRRDGREDLADAQREGQRPAQRSSEVD